tara:strand:+ start:532 stop:696 length:165 start_codon:yes stop_codon:yes gene_type:complete
MHHQKTKKRNKKKSKQKSNSPSYDDASYRSEYNGYQPDSPLTKYFEKNILKNRN